MAYLAFSEATAGQAASSVPFAPAITPSFSALEWSVIALAGRDRLSSLREPGRMSVAMGAIFGSRPNPRLADPRLEALRRVALLARVHGYRIPTSERRRFEEAGFDERQYELLIESVASDRADRHGGRA
jgi:hypothetical protein